MLFITSHSRIMNSCVTMTMEWSYVTTHNLTHWGRVTHICISKLPTIGSDNGLSPGRHQAIIWTNAGILLFGPLGSNFSEILIAIDTFSFKKMHLKLSSAKWRPFCLGLNVLNVMTQDESILILWDFSCHLLIDRSEQVLWIEHNQIWIACLTFYFLSV